jgi:hypothetical protein
VAGVLLAAATGPALAQAPPAVSEAQRLLQGAADPGDFADTSVAGFISLKHKPSGLICLFGDDPKGNALHASPEGVICESSSPAEIDTVEAFHMPHASDADVNDAINRAVGAFNGPKPVSGFTDSQSDRLGAPKHTSLRFVAATRAGEQLFVRVAYAQVGDWFLLQRVLSTTAGAKLADADGERRMLANIGQVMDGQKLGAR